MHDRGLGEVASQVNHSLSRALTEFPGFQRLLFDLGSVARIGEQMGSVFSDVRIERLEVISVANANVIFVWSHAHCDEIFLIEFHLWLEVEGLDVMYLDALHTSTSSARLMGLQEVVANGSPFRRACLLLLLLAVDGVNDSICMSNRLK